jgi:hypothetical protein
MARRGRGEGSIYHLVFGIREESGVPVGVCGLQGIDADREILQLEKR